VKGHQPMAGSGTVLVTGCSSGIGHETAALLVRRGYRTFATMRRADERGHTLAAATVGTPGELEVRELDVTRREEVERVVEEAAERGDLVAVVNNAGTAIAGFFEDLADDQMRTVFETNFFGLGNVTRAAIPHLKRRGRGTIVQVSSGGGRVGLPLLATYAASKHAVEGLSEVLHHELRPLGIRVILLEPGWHRTRIQSDDRRIVGLGAGEDTPRVVVERLMAQTRAMVERMGRDPAHAAEAIVKLIESPNPRLRHPVGPDAWLMLAAKRFLPYRLFEMAVGRMLRGAGYPEDHGGAPVGDPGSPGGEAAPGGRGT
jgi:NAD(P)-dependent dehydrogenase (short-subunit alcohol dehydrogenase family)